MSNRFWQSMLAVVMIVCVQCTVHATALGRPAEKKGCPPPGTFVPFAKVTSTGFAQDYERCHIRTTAFFMMPGKGGMVGGDIKGCTIFQVVAPGQSGTRNPISGALQGTWAYIRNDRSDVIFDLKAGESIEIIGGPAFIGDKRYGMIAFMADSLWRSPAEADSAATRRAAPDTAAGK